MIQQIGLVVTHRIKGFYCPHLLTTEQTAVYHLPKSTGFFFFFFPFNRAWGKKSQFTGQVKKTLRCKVSAQDEKNIFYR